MFSAGKDREISRLSALASDLMEQLRSERALWAAERKELLDRIMVLAQPASLRLMQPQPPRERTTSPFPPRVLLPGTRPDMRPPVKPREVVMPPKQES